MTDDGENVSESTQDCPGPSTVPAAQPLAAKPVAENEAAPSVIAALPSFVSVTVCGPDVAPTTKLPNAIARGSVQR